MSATKLPQRWQAPASPRPIIFVGAGGIVRAAHVPAYRAARFPMAGAFDVNASAARSLAASLPGCRVYRTLAEAAREREVIFDVAVPAGEILGVLRALPEGAAALIQKPMGRDLKEARAIVDVCKKREITAAVNFQLRFAPNLLALRAAVDRGILGSILDVEVRVATFTPWANWTFLRSIPRLEILYHSIHYLDWVRSLLGEPLRVTAWVGGDPRARGYADVRSTSLLDYGDRRALVTTQHFHRGKRHAVSELRIEGTAGRAVARLGVNLDYPRGLPDTLELERDGRHKTTSRSVALRGSWFPHAFEGTMASLQRFVAGESRELPTAVGDALQTMALVERCYRSAQKKADRFL